MSDDSGRRERAYRIFDGLFTSLIKNCQANICFAIFLVRIFLGGGTSFTEVWQSYRSKMWSTQYRTRKVSYSSISFVDNLFSVKRQKREKINAKVGVYQGSLSLPRGWWQKFAYKDGICLQLNTFIEQLRFTDKRIWSFPLDIWEEIYLADLMT